MARDRAWRRHMEQKHTTKRLRRLIYRPLWKFFDANNVGYENPTLSNYIGTPTHFMYKTYTTTRGDSEHKIKYSPNRGGPYWRDGNGKKSTREKQKREFLRIKKEYGIR